MTCHICGADMRRLVTDLPLKVSDAAIVIVKRVPVIQCESCSDYLLEDNVMKRVEELLETANSGAELEVVSFAA